MKKVLLIVASVLVAGLSAYAQGTLEFANRNIGGVTGANAPVYDLTVGGTLLNETSFVQIFAGPAGSAASALQAQGSPVNFRVSPANGYVSSSTVTLNNLDFGQTIAVQVRAWNAAGGTTWAAAQAAWNSQTAGVEIGQSTIFSVTLPAASAPPPLPTPLTGLQSFAIVPNVVPEPTTIALGLLGAALLFIRRRQ